MSLNDNPSALSSLVSLNLSSVINSRKLNFVFSFTILMIFLAKISISITTPIYNSISVQRIILCTTYNTAVIFLLNQ